MILGMNNDGAVNNVSPFRSEGGDESSVNQWIRASIHLEFMSLGLVHRDAAVIAENERVYEELISECMSWDGATASQCKYKITGLCDWLFNMWTESDLSNSAVHEEWNSGSANTVTCDPEGTVCHWELGDYANSYASSFSRTGKPVNNRLTSYMLDTKQETIRNFINIHNYDNLNNLKDVHDYCTNSRAGLKTDCLAMRRFETLGKEDYMNYFRNDETTNIYNASDPSAPIAPDGQIYEDIACGVSQYLFEGWGKGNDYMTKAVTTWFNERWPDHDDAVIDSR